MLRPYVTYEDVKAICPFVDQLQPGSDQFLVQRLAARDWLDSTITAALGYSSWGSVVVSSRVTRACAYRAAGEILMTQITPVQSDNAYRAMSRTFQRLAENEISTLSLKIRLENGTLETIDLSIRKRGYHG